VTHRRQKGTDDRLLQLLGEQMKLPLLQIARQAELARMSAGPAELLESIELAADGALKLIDSYLLSLRLAHSQASLQLEPVSVAAVLNDTAHQLGHLARQYECKLELHLSGRYEPIMAHRAGLEAALMSLGYVFIEGQSAMPAQKQTVIKLAAHRSKSGIVAGMFASTDGLSADMYRRARRLYGQAHQPLTSLPASSGAGVFVADSLLASMSARLRIAHHQKLTGLAATFMPSSQLNLI
jgi:hypothetical protein